MCPDQTSDILREIYLSVDVLCNNHRVLTVFLLSVKTGENLQNIRTGDIRPMMHRDGQSFSRSQPAEPYGNVMATISKCALHLQYHPHFHTGTSKSGENLQLTVCHMDRQSPLISDSWPQSTVIKAVFFLNSTKYSNCRVKQMIGVVLMGGYVKFDPVTPGIYWSESFSLQGAGTGGEGSWVLIILKCCIILISPLAH